ncbi:uncharacterized protein N7473_002824 [Penicillium subrubescens]|uniref:uncharacterized protein n=1 Tax=Penicillium subrubescens TaxID=1316194 RepID=UPI0025455FD3|nr:uncharacterized protein N7473_002824 [Penicillium subrubescens]KAJ5905908.1 hypothetical protein N7473_002824 [Penicillium subrubescens]
MDRLHTSGNIEPKRVANSLGHKRKWVTHVDLTVSSLQGLVVAFWDERLIGIHAFTECDDLYRAFREHMESLRRALPPSTYFQPSSGKHPLPVRRFFFPMKNTERIRGIWIRGYGSFPEPYIFKELEIQTTKDRFHNFGYCSPSLSYSLTGSEDGKLTGITYGRESPTTRGVSHMAVFCDTWGPATSNPRPDPGYQRDHDKFSLGNLIGIQVSFAGSSRAAAMGLLLHYGNGDIEVLGEIHWHEPMSALIHNPIRYCKDGSPGYHFQSYNECTATSEWKVWPLTGTSSKFPRLEQNSVEAWNPELTYSWVR